MMINRRQEAFSLIEMIVTIVVLSIVGVITINYVISASRLYVSVHDQRRAESEAITALNRMRKEVRALRTTFMADDNQFGFSNRNDVANTFALNGTDLTLNGNILARNVDTFVLAYYDSTNSPLSPLPLADPLDRHNIRRIAVDLKVRKGAHAAGMNVNIFYPEEGIVK